MSQGANICLEMIVVAAWIPACLPMKGLVVELLPTAYEVWGKVMFLHLSVILFTRGVVCPGGVHVVCLGVCVQGCGVSRGCIPGCVEGWCVQGGLHLPPTQGTPRYGQPEVGTRHMLASLRLYNPYIAMFY